MKTKNEFNRKLVFIFIFMFFVTVMLSYLFGSIYANILTERYKDAINQNLEVINELKNDLKEERVRYVSKLEEIQTVERLCG